MKATGIVRRIDDLGRVVIPKEIRRTMRIREGDPLEIYTDNDGEVIFKKYSPIGELSNFAGQYAEVLYKTHGIPVAVCDRDHVVAAAGIPKKEILGRRVASQLEEIIEQRKRYFYAKSDWREKKFPVEGLNRHASVICPIIAQDSVCGCIALMPEETDGIVTGTDIKLAQMVATLLGQQMEW